MNELNNLSFPERNNELYKRVNDPVFRTRAMLINFGAIMIDIARENNMRFGEFKAMMVDQIDFYWQCCRAGLQIEKEDINPWDLDEKP